MKKILTMLGALSLVISSSATVISCRIETLNVEDGKQNTLKKISLETNLGEFENAPTHEEIFNRIKELNPNIQLNQIEIISSTAEKVEIKVIANSTIYLQETINLTYSLKEWSSLKDHLKNTEFGLFESKPNSKELLTRAKELNPSLFLDELTLKMDEKMTNEAIISVKPNSKVYYQDSEKINFDINYDDSITNSFIERAKSLVIAENFNLNHQKTYEVINQNNQETLNSNYAEFFQDKSINQSETNANLKGSIGQLGGFFGLFANEEDLEFDIPAELELILKGLSEDDELVFSDLPFEKFTQIINLAFNFLSSMEISEMIGFLPILSLINLPMEIVETIKAGYEDFEKTALDKDTIVNVLDALKAGTDLSRFIKNPNLTINDLYSGAVFAFINTLGYGIDQNYQEINTLEQVQASGEGKYNSALNYFDKWINENKIYDFQFNPTNAGKIIENLMLTVSILNHVLSFYRTSDVDYSTMLANKQDPSQYLFSNTISNATTNDNYMSKLTKTKISEIKHHNWKAFNVGEIIANLKYYLGSGEHAKYRFQKLIYIMLVNGDELSPFATFIKLYLVKTLGIEGIPFASSVIRELFHDDIFYPLANNKELKLRDFWSGWNSIRWTGISLAIDIALGSGMGSVIKQLLADIQWYLGPKSFDGLYYKDLETILGYFVNRGLPDEQIFKDLLKTLDQTFGSREVKSLEVLLTQVKLNDLVSLSGIERNPNQPSHGSYYLDRTIVQLIDDLGTAFNITGFETNEMLKNKYLDFNLIASLVNELFFAANNQETGLINQIIDSLDNMSQVLSLLGIVNAENSTDGTKIVWESFLGKVMQLLFPELEAKPFIDTNELKGLYNHGQWLLKGIKTLLDPLLIKEEISNFVSTIWTTDDAFEIETKKEYFENVKVLKSITTIIEFDPNTVIFEDQSKLNGEKVKYEITASRDKKQDKFIYKSIYKINNSSF